MSDPTEIVEGTIVNGHTEVDESGIYICEMTDSEKIDATYNAVMDMRDTVSRVVSEIGPTIEALANNPMLGFLFKSKGKVNGNG
jgi:hypothetical protein